jgi:Asp-tRNA(Asn)/Glu-tRNA(Gln) amidotransferase A subunit family amidase
METRLSFTSALELARLIRDKAVSPVEVVEASLRRIENLNPTLNCFCFTYPDEALDKARAAERAVMRNQPLGALHGVPIAIKDLTPTRGKRTTRGSYIHEHDVPNHDAVIVERLFAAGGIMVGKTTTPEYAHTFSTQSPLGGVTRNPWNLEHIPGGSSGGSAVAVATGCVALAEGSDMGGSVRTPASFSGIVGLKPSFGRIPFDILPSQFDQTCHFGPLVRSVDDAALFLKVTQGPDDRDIQSQVSPSEVQIPASTALQGRRIAFSRGLGYCAIDADVEKNFLVAIERLRDQGAVVEEVDPGLSPEYEASGWAHWEVYYASLLGEYLKKWRDKMDPTLVEFIERGLRIPATELKKVEFIRTELWRKLRPIFASHEALLCPTTALPAPRIGETEFGEVDEQGQYHGLELTFPFNLVGQCPALAMPTGLTSTGLPTSIQIVGRRYDDVGVLGIGAALEKLLPAMPRPSIALG